MVLILLGHVLYLLSLPSSVHHVFKGQGLARARLAGQGATGICLPLPPEHWNKESTPPHGFFLHGFWASNSGLMFAQYVQYSVLQDHTDNIRKSARLR